MLGLNKNSENTNSPLYVVSVTTVSIHWICF